MCKFASLIVLRDPVKALYLEGEDSHSTILEHFNLPDDRPQSSVSGPDHEPKFARVELVPISDEAVFTKDLSKFKFNLDEPRRPEWFSPAHEQAAFNALADLLNATVYTSQTPEDPTNRKGLWLRDVNIVAVSNCNITRLAGSSTVEYMHDSSTVQDMRDSSTIINMHGSSTIINMHGSSTVRHMYASSTVINMYASSTVINMYASSTVINMYASSTVQDMRDSSTVQDMRGSSTIINMRDSSTVQDMRDSSVAISRTLKTIRTGSPYTFQPQPQPQPQPKPEP